MVKICVSGSKGRMGERIIALAKDDAELSVSGAFDVGDDAAAAIDGCDCVIEFTSPQATVEHLAQCVARGKAIVIGTTGLSDGDVARIREAAGSVPVVFSPNMSIGVNLLFKVVRDAAKTLRDGYDVRIVEAHHTNKKDAPSGTAKELARTVRAERAEIEVPIDSIREADIIGEHTVTFESAVDTIEFTHSAKTRDIFAQGALAAAKFAVAKGPGLYTMQDVLGL